MVPLNVPTFIITNTRPEFFWLPNYLETMLSNCLWKTSTSATTALRAWCVLERAHNDFWPASELTFDDVTITACVRSLGGWERLCNVPDDQFETWIKKEFLDLYAALAGTELREDQVAPLLGIGQGGPVKMACDYATPTPTPVVRLPSRAPAGLLENIGASK